MNNSDRLDRSTIGPAFAYPGEGDSPDSPVSASATTHRLAADGELVGRMAEIEPATPVGPLPPDAVNATPHLADPAPVLDAPASAQVLNLPNRAVTSAHSASPTPALAGARSEIPRGWTLVGDLECADHLVLRGAVRGSTLMSNPDAEFVLEPTGQIEGDVTGRRVVLRGELRGDVDATDGSVIIDQTASVRGKVTYNSVVISGGRHQLELMHQDQTA